MPGNHNAPRKTNDSPIARARLAKGMTQAQLADALGVTQQQIGSWEAGKRKPKILAMMRLGKALGVDWVSLIDNQGEDNHK